MIYFKKAVKKKEKPNVKRMIINGKTKVIKVDLAVGDAIFIEKDKKKGVYNFYFPQDAPNHIYALGVAMPIDVLNAYDQARVNQMIEINSKKFVEEASKKLKSPTKVAEVPIPDVEIGD